MFDFDYDHTEILKDRQERNLDIIDNLVIPDSEAIMDEMNIQGFIRRYYGTFLIVLVLLLWICRILTWKYEIDIRKRSYTRKQKHCAKKFDVKIDTNI